MKNINNNICFRGVKAKYNNMFKLIAKLIMADIPIDIEIDEIFDNAPHIYYPSKENCICSVICHFGSYGFEKGLLEIMGLLTEEEYEYDSVVGWLNADQVFDRIYDHFYNKSKKYS